MNMNILIGGIVGTAVSLGWNIYYKECSRVRLAMSAIIFTALMVWAFLDPCKAEAWCEKCRPIPFMVF